MTRFVDILILGLPLMVLSLVLGLGLGFAVLMTDGRDAVRLGSRIVAGINLALTLPLGLLAVMAETGDVRWMFVFAVGAFAVVGLLGFRFPARFDDGPPSAAA